MKVTLFIMKKPPSFELFKVFIKYFKSDYGDFRHNQI